MWLTDELLEEINLDLEIETEENEDEDNSSLSKPSVPAEDKSKGTGDPQGPESKVMIS